MTLFARIGAVAALVLGVWAASVGAASAQDAATVLSARDVDRYRQIFDLQEDGRWAAADKLIARLDDDVLMGHVLFQRYMHPTAYRSKFSELQGWLAKYADHPGADRIWTLARSRGKGRLRRPEPTKALGGGRVGGGYPDSLVSRYGGHNARVAGKLWRTFRRALARGHTLNVKQVVLSEKARLTLSQIDHDRMRAWLAYAYFIDGRDQWALDWARKAVEGSGDKVPRALWAAGLAAWRLGDIEDAARWFGRLARSEVASPWMRAGGAYWAARASLRARTPQETSRLLAQAAEYPRTFYGLLARRALGLPLQFRWQNERLNAREAAALAGAAKGRRAMALIEVGQPELAREELRRLYPEGSPAQREAILRLADVSGLPALAYRLAGRIAEDAENAVADSARYPIPRWEPATGWRLDRALLFAFVRQESGFNPNARSYAGAHGLMQVMPATAAFIANDSSLRWRSGRKKLLAPEVNLALGQKYLEYLLDLPEVDGNLFFAAAAYNAGPGNLRKWQRRTNYHDDPLLFIEGIPSRETRVYIERVVANLWIYRDRFGQPAPSLDMVAGGQWPIYAQQDEGGMTVAQAEDAAR